MKNDENENLIYLNISNILSNKINIIGIKYQGLNYLLFKQLNNK